MNSRSPRRPIIISPDASHLKTGLSRGKSFPILGSSKVAQQRYDCSEANDAHPIIFSNLSHVDNKLEEISLMLCLTRCNVWNK